MSGFIQEGDMVRLNAIQRAQSIPESITPYCTDTDQLDMAARYRVIICTCSTAGQLYSLGLRAGHITHAFVDEAGQATEPECLVAVGLAAGDDGQVVLAGDPFQLGPVLQSRVASSYGLEISLLERLMGRPLYCRNEDKFSDHGCYDPLLVTKLINNYRSHPAVLKLSSAVFYHDELKPCADVRMRESLCQWERLPNKGFPVIFHGLKGEDIREGNSPSWFNPVEAVQVVKYLQSLRSSDKFSLKLTDIGVITPYRKQVEKLRLLLDRLGLEEVKVGSVEEFQGQERLAIIISTVRSNESLVGVDVRHSVGFLSNPKRFNVAITRAQALLVVVGNPHVLCQDPYWCCLLQYCVMNDAYVGCDLPSLDQQLMKEEFHTATDLLRKALRAKDKIQANNEEASSPKFLENTLTEDTSTRNSCLQAKKCNVVTKYRDSNTLSCKTANNSCNFESKQEQDKDVSKNNTEHTITLTSEGNSSTGLSHEVGSFSEKTALAELRFPDIDAATTSILREQDSESEDELEQFVFQPKSGREENRNFSSTNFKLNK